ncbi:hypothetical protein ACIQWL_49840 [Streptomyces mirabilis]|uniref:hypothetical protein n=1 Tax=Streptomyces mirabilis TaxID=68239 RepID=UPI00324B090E
MLLRLPYLALPTDFSLIRLLPMSDRAKDLEILALRPQLAVLQGQVDKPPKKKEIKKEKVPHQRRYLE